MNWKSGQVVLVKICLCSWSIWTAYTAARGWHRLSTLENCEGSVAKEGREVGLLRQLMLNPQKFLPSQYNLNELIER